MAKKEVVGKDHSLIMFHGDQTTQQKELFKEAGFVEQEYWREDTETQAFCGRYGHTVLVSLLAICDRCRVGKYSDIGIRSIISTQEKCTHVWEDMHEKCSSCYAKREVRYGQSV